MGDFEGRPEGSEGEMGGRPRPECEDGEDCGPPPCEDGEECLGPPPGEREMGGLQSANRLMNLSNESTLTSLESDGLAIGLGNNVHFSVSENLTTGYQWMLKPDECVEQLKITESYDPPAYLEGEQELMGAPGTKYYSLQATNGGACTFEAVLARSWEFSWEANSENYVDKIEIDVDVIQALQ